MNRAQKNSRAFLARRAAERVATSYMGPVAIPSNNTAFIEGADWERRRWKKYVEQAFLKGADWERGRRGRATKKKTL